MLQLCNLNKHWYVHNRLESKLYFFYYIRFGTDIWHIHRVNTAASRYWQCMFVFVDFSGPNCDQSADNCAGTPCGIGASLQCIDGDGTHSCMCAALLNTGAGCTKRKDYSCIGRFALVVITGTAGLYLTMYTRSSSKWHWLDKGNGVPGTATPR